MPRPPQVYGALLKDLIVRHGVNCWLVNTGWTGGPPGVGHRISLSTTRRLVNAALEGEIGESCLRIEPHFGLAIPKTLLGLKAESLDPALTWSSAQSYAEAAKSLRLRFDEAIAQLAL